jgi:hypothetical protein
MYIYYFDSVITFHFLGNCISFRHLKHLLISFWPLYTLVNEGDKWVDINIWSVFWWQKNIFAYEPSFETKGIFFGECKDLYPKFIKAKSYKFSFFIFSFLKKLFNFDYWKVTGSLMTFLLANTYSGFYDISAYLPSPSYGPIKNCIHHR